MKETGRWLYYSVWIMIFFPIVTIMLFGFYGVAVCTVVFWVGYPFFFMACGEFARTNIKELWYFPVIPAAMFLIWPCFFNMFEYVHLLYSGVYLAIAWWAMLTKRSSDN